ncbi:hypothetical protein ACU610_22855 [Geodermatophilus sp. URMC 61]|uniref:hypothetical protein n=1 Tax=Geodermatophilus sp. URMC 61 TaxID=3423411 RepID=UPI00406BECF8
MPDGGPDAEAWRLRRTSSGSVAAGPAGLRPDHPADAVTVLLGQRRGACSTRAPAPAC